MLYAWTKILYPYRTSIKWGRPSAESCWAAIAVLLIAALAGAGASLLQQRRPSRAGRFTLDLAVLAACLLTADALRQYHGVTLIAAHEWVSRVGVAPLILSGLVTAAATLRWRRAVVWVCAIVFLALSPFEAITAARAAMVAVRTDFPSVDPTVASRGTGRRAPGPRVVVLVLDEFDYGMAFDARPADVALPAFDRLRGEALFATNAHAPAGSTDLSMASYLLGRVVDDVLRVGPSEVRIRLAGDTARRAMTSAETMVGDAARLGAPAALVGVHLPYCRWELAAELDQCTWRPFTLGGVADGPVGLPRAILRQLFALSFLGNRIAQVDRLRELDTAAFRAASDSGLRLVFLHLPVPHLPPVWDRSTSSFTLVSLGASGYFDNLALADRVLADLRRSIAAAGLTERTTLVVTSDHPWRGGPIAGVAPGDRVPFIVHMPDGGAREWEDRVETVRLRALASGLLAGEIRTTADLARWLAKHRGNGPDR
jgi:hypothetical protein